MPPTGGFGGNTGVADAHNLAWKLAYVTRGIGMEGAAAPRVRLFCPPEIILWEIQGTSS